MHYVVVIGTAESRTGQRFVLYKDPAQPEPDKVIVLEETTFVAAWENTPIHGSWWSGLASFITNTPPRQLRATGLRHRPEQAVTRAWTPAIEQVYTRLHPPFPTLDWEMP